MVDLDALEEKVGQALEMDEGGRMGLGKAGREWFVENDRFFRIGLVEVILG